MNVAVMVTVCGELTDWVAIVNVAEPELPKMVTFEGTVAMLGLELLRVTTSPVGEASPFRLTVPVAVDPKPPVTDW